MYLLKIALGLLALFIAWAYLFHNGFIFRINAWMRENVFNDRMVLFSGRRVALLLMILGLLALFSGLQGIIQIQPIKPNIAAQMLEQAKNDFHAKRYEQVIRRCHVLVRADPNAAEAWELLVNSWWALGDKAKARGAASVLLRINPNHPLAKSVSLMEPEKTNKGKP